VAHASAFTLLISTSMDNFNLSYREFLNRGRAWSPTWSSQHRGFDCWLIFAPPGVTTLETEADYRTLLARRVEYLLQDWLELYSDELPLSVDREDEAAVWVATLEMIAEYIPLRISPDLTVPMAASAAAQTIAQTVMPPRLATIQFPVDLPLLEPDEDYAYCLVETTLKGWVIEAS
jgi:hypothetical protein